MTLVAALDGRNNTILFADTEEIIAGYTKREMNKLLIQEGGAFRFGIAGASNDGTYADMLQSEICAALIAIQEFDLIKVKESLTDILTTFYSKHIWPRAGEKPEMSYLLALQPLIGGHPAILHISETAANICTEEARTIGVGSYLADYLFKQMTAGDLPFPPSQSVDFLCAAAVYVAKEVRENIQGVGPLKRIAVFNSDGTFDDLWPSDIYAIEDYVSSIGEFLRYFYGDAFATDESDLLSEAGWAADIREGLKGWYTKWNSEEERQRRRSVREMEMRKQHAMGT